MSDSQMNVKMSDSQAKNLLLNGLSCNRFVESLFYSNL